MVTVGEDERQFQDMAARFGTTNGAEKVWEDIFSEEERTVLSSDLNKAWNTNGGTLGMAAAVWGCGRDEALMRICEACQSYDPATLRRLRRERGLAVSDPQTPSEPQIPKWNRDLRELRFKGKVIREIQSTSVAKHVVSILDAFELENWPDRIDNPLPFQKGRTAKGDSETLRGAIKTLNISLSQIRFYADGKRMGVIWRKRPTPHLPRTINGKKSKQSRRCSGVSIDAQHRGKWSNQFPVPAEPGRS